MSVLSETDKIEKKLTHLGRLIFMKEIDMLEYNLVDKGYKKYINTQTVDRKFTLLMGVADTKTAELLLKHGAKSGINLQDSAGWTALIHCCSMNDIKVAELLLKNGAADGINLRTKGGDTALGIARWRGSP